MEITVSVDVSAVRALLNSQSRRINLAMRGGINDATALLLRDMRTYPAQRPGSSYQRTGTLRNSWSRRPPQGQGLDMYGVVGSDPQIAPYNAQVQHPELQAAMHVGRWQTTETVTNLRRGLVQQMFDDRMREAFAGT